MLVRLPVYLASLPLAAALVSFAVVLVFAVPFRIVLGWLYNRTNSLIIVALFHAAFNGTGASGILDKGAVHLPASFRRDPHRRRRRPGWSGGPAGGSA